MSPDSNYTNTTSSLNETDLEFAEEEGEPEYEEGYHNQTENDEEEDDDHSRMT